MAAGLPCSRVRLSSSKAAAVGSHSSALLMQGGAAFTSLPASWLNLSWAMWCLAMICIEDTDQLRFHACTLCCSCRGAQPSPLLPASWLNLSRAMWCLALLCDNTTDKPGSPSNMHETLESACRGLFPSPLACQLRPHVAKMWSASELLRWEGVAQQHSQTHS